MYEIYHNNYFTTNTFYYKFFYDVNVTIMIVRSRLPLNFCLSCHFNSTSNLGVDFLIQRCSANTSPGTIDLASLEEEKESYKSKKVNISEVGGSLSLQGSLWSYPPPPPPPQRFVSVFLGGKHVLLGREEGGYPGLPSPDETMIMQLPSLLLSEGLKFSIFSH